MNKRPVFILLLVIAMITWGLSWASGKFVANKALPEVLLFWRFSLTFLSLIPVVLLSDKSLRISKKGFVFAAAGGGVMALYNYMFFQGLHTGLAGAGGVLVTTMNPVFTFLLVSLMQGRSLPRRETAGLLLGVAGGLVMIRVWHFSLQDLLATGNLYFITASASWALMTIVSQMAGSHASALKFSLYVHLVAAALSFVPASAADWTGVFNFPASFWLNIFYLSVVSTTFGTSVYFAASQKVGSKTASSFIFIVPVMALFSGIYFLGENPDLILLTGGSLSLVAVYLINMKKPAK